MALDEQELREAASHRGLKLVKSRKRKPGVGDYGHFGLTDAAGKPLLGIDDGVLTATAQEIADYLRKGEVSTWAESARTTPDRPKAMTPPPQSVENEGDPPRAIRPRPKSKDRRSSPEVVEETKAQRERRPSGQSETRRVSQEPASPKIKQKPAPTLELSIRSGKPADARRLVGLLSENGSNISETDLRRAIGASTGRKEPILVAVRDGLIGFLAWHVIPTLLDGRIARITAIAVDEDERRRGVGRALFEAADKLFAKQKVARIEIVSDIAVRNVNGFYRAMGLEQTSYRFSKPL